jgi:hypothetical protein
MKQIRESLETPKFGRHINQFIQDTKSIELPTVYPFFKRGKRQWAEVEFEVPSEPDSEEEMMLMITTVPAITAISKVIKVMYYGRSVSEVLYESPR